MPGLVPGIHVFGRHVKEGVDGRDVCAKTRFALLPGHDGEEWSAAYRCGSRSNAGMPSGTWWNGCLSMV